MCLHLYKWTNKLYKHLNLPTYLCVRICHRFIFSDQEQSQAQRELWMMEDILDGLRVNRDHICFLLGVQRHHSEQHSINLALQGNLASLPLIHPLMSTRLMCYPLECGVSLIYLK